MNNGEVIRPWMTARVDELRALEQALRSQKGAVIPEQVGRVLACAGDLLRRPFGSGVSAQDLEDALSLLSSAAIDAWSLSLDVASIESRLRRALDEAVESALPEVDEDAGTWAAWAKEGIEARDRLQSQWVALARREPVVAKRLGAALESQDHALRPRSRWLVGLNGWRRVQRDSLSPDHRAQAWWFTDRSECDELLRALAGENARGTHLQTCAACQRDLGTVASANTTRTRHLSEDELWNLDLGLLSGQQRVVIDTHVRKCGECAKAVAALEEGEETIRELTTATTVITATATTTVTGGTLIPIRPQMRSAGEPEVLAENADFRLLLFRRKEHPKIVVQPSGPGRVAAAAVFVPEDPGRALSARPGPEGFEIELPESLRTRGAIHVKVRLRSSHEVQHPIPSPWTGGY